MDMTFQENYVLAVQRLSWDVLDILTKELGRPTEGFIAEAIWRKSNSEPSAKAAKSALHQMGYQAYKGFPLRINGDRAPDDKARFLALEAAKAEIEENGPYLERAREIMQPKEIEDATS